MPAPLNVHWPEIRQAVEKGMPVPEAAQRFGASEAAIRKRSQRERWLTDHRLAKEVQSRQSRLVPHPSAKDALAMSIEDMGADLRRTALEMARNSLSSLRQAGSLPIESWQDFKTATETGMKAAGLDNAPSQQVQILIADSPAKIIDASE